MSVHKSNPKIKKYVVSSQLLLSLLVHGYHPTM